MNTRIEGVNLYDGETLMGTFATESAAWSCKYALDKAQEKTPEQDYWEDVRNMAQSIADEIESRANDGELGETLREWLQEHIHESIDGSARIIYTRQAQECLIYSSNDGAYFEEFGDEGAVSDGCINWSAIAFSAFERDVIEQLDAIGVDVNEPGPKCEECGDWIEAGEKKDGKWYCDSCVPEEEEEEEEEEEAQ